MAQQPIELILVRQLASCLGTPIVLVDHQGDLLFLNEAAEALVGVRFDEVGELTLAEWVSTIAPTDDRGRALRAPDLPLARALLERQPCHMELGITGLDGVRRRLAVTAVPLEGGDGAGLGAMAVLWPAPGS